MTDNRGQLSTYAPGTVPVDRSRVSQAPRPDPTPAPSFLTTAAAGFRTAVDEQTFPQEGRLADAYMSLERDLYASGVDRRALHRLRATTPEEMTQSMGLAAPTTDLLDRDAVWNAVTALRARDPKALPGLATDRDAFERDVLRRHGGRDRDQAVLARGSTVAQIAGGIPASFLDPVNLATLPIGGAEAGLARRIAMDALTNAGVEALQLPGTIANRERLGEHTSASEAAGQVAMAAGFGAAVPVAGRVYGETIGRAAGALLTRNRSWAGQMADRMRADIGADRFTPEEAQAARTLDREDEVMATSPFTPGPGSSAHIERMEAARETLTRPPAIREGGRVASAPIAAPGAARAQFKAMVRGAESSGDDQAAAATTSAYGRYQFTKKTWLRLMRDDLGPSQTFSDATLLARRAIPAFQERMMDKLTDENAAALRRVGAPETAGNLYLMHFAGQRDGARILTARPDTAIEAVMGRESIHSNRFLEGKTVGEVIDWARAKMKDRSSGAPVLRRDEFGEGVAGDAEWAAAQREVDATEAALAQRRQTDGGGDDAPDPFGDRPLSDVGDAPRIDVADEGAGVPAYDAAADWRTRVAALRETQGGEIRGAMEHPEIGSIDVKWGEAGNPEKNYAGGYGLAHILAKHPEMEAELDRLPELIARMDVTKDDGRTVRLSDGTYDAGVRLDWDGDRQRWLVTAYERDTPAAPVSSRDAAGDRASPDRGATDNVGPQGGESKPTADMIDYWRSQIARGDAPEPLYAIRPEGGGEIVWSTPSKRQASRLLREEPDQWTMERHDAPDDLTAAQTDADGFDSPDDIAAERQFESLEHDLRMALDEGEDFGVRLSDDGDVVSLADMMAEQGLDEAAFDAAEACMKGGAA